MQPGGSCLQSREDAGTGGRATAGPRGNSLSCSDRRTSWELGEDDPQRSRPAIYNEFYTSIREHRRHREAPVAWQPPPVASGALREHPVWPSSLALAVVRLRGPWVTVESVWGEVGWFCAAVRSVPSWLATGLAPCLHPHHQRRYATQPRYTWTGAFVRCQYGLKNGAPSQKVLRSLCFLSHPPTPTPAQHL